MTASLGHGEVEQFRSIVARRFGLQVDDARLASLAEVLRRRLEANGQVCEAYLSRLATEAARVEIRTLAQELTVAETYFFRHIDQFHAFRDVALAELRRPGSGTGVDHGGRFRILSAGCASGEEPYSIAILARESLVAEPAWEVSIRAVDINPAMLEKAVAARFSAWALRETPSDIQCRWFQHQGREVVLHDAARSLVAFEERNLTEDDPELWQPNAYDAVFCRNVIMYFTPQSARALVARIARSLVPGGYLFLGHAETLRGLSQDFHLRHMHGAFYYQRKEDWKDSPTQAVLNRVSSAGMPSQFASVIRSANSWVDAIHGAADRIRALAPPTPRPPPLTPSPRWELGLALDLVRRERFAEALDLLQAFPAESARDIDVRLLHAVLLVHSGRLAEAEGACRCLLDVDELNAGAHYLLALCRESVGDRPSALEHDQVAIYLDPDFAMPHLHLGLAARRAGQQSDARRELDQARVLLQREDASRVLLFGGGFSRETLIALCHAELQACGGEP
ncbi:MAG: methyltransferase domain-containing protein [Acidobacteria bacterium]|nr:methyltransferase domain-containing protein [Acidobacteriota bacterium]